MDSDRSQIMESLSSPQNSHYPVEQGIEATEEASAAFEGNLLSEVKDTLETMVSKIATYPAEDW